MKRKFLEELGIEKETVDKIMAENGKDIETAKGDLETIKAELENAKAVISERDKQLKELEKSVGDNEELKTQLENLQAENKKQAEAHATEIDRLKMDNAINSALGAAGARNAKAVRGLFDESGFKLNDKGEVEGLAEAIKAVQKSDGYLFEDKQPSHPQFKGFQPGASGDGLPSGRADTSNMTYSELAAYMAANPDVTI